MTIKPTTQFEPYSEPPPPSTSPKRNRSIRTGTGLKLTDLENARRLVARHGKNLRYVHPWKSWLAWGGTRWAPDQTGEAMRRAKDIPRQLLNEAAEAPESKRPLLIEWAQKSADERRIRALLTLAQSEPGIAVPPENLDADAWLFNCTSCTLDLRSGELRRHRREDLLTKVSPIAYDPHAEAPRFLRFIEEITLAARGRSSRS